MRTNIAIFLFLTSLLCRAVSDTHILAMSDWSEAVSTPQGQSLRARMILGQGHSAGHAGPWPETQFYLELQNVSGANRSPIEAYFDPAHGLKCELRDANGKSPSQAGGGSGGGPAATWITLPHDSTIRLRANMYGYGRKPEDGLLLCLWTPDQYWNISAGDTNIYYLSGTFAVTSPANLARKDPENAGAPWTGTLRLPQMKIELPKGK
jgi:hypothetical protein